MSTVGSQGPPKRRGWKVAGVAAAVATLVAVTVGVSWFVTRHDVSPEELQRLERLKNVALGHLENSGLKEKAAAGQGDLSLADRSFLEIAERLTGEPLGYRDLAITRLLALKRKLLAPAAALAAADRLLQVESGSVAAHVLAARVARETGDELHAVNFLNRATELDPDDAAPWYDLYQLGLASRDEAVKQRGYEALGQAHRIAPTNLFVLGNWLVEQAQRQDPPIRQTLQTLRDTLDAMPGLADNIRKESRGEIPDVARYIDEAIAAADQNNWPEVASRARVLKAVILPQTWAQSDQRRVDKNDLEFVLQDFVKRHSRDGADVVEETIPVSFAEFPSQRPPAALLGIEDIELADFDLDGKLDLFVLREAVVEVYGRTPADDGWQKIAECSVPPGLKRLLVADLDLDNPYQPGTQAFRDRMQAAKAGANHDEEHQDECLAVGLDCIAYGPAGMALLRNRLDREKQVRTLEPVAPAAPCSQVEGVLAVAVADIYHDGDLDLIVSTSEGLAIWSNQGDMRFADVSTRSQMPPRELQATAIVPVDWDRDVDLDLVVAGPTGAPAGYLENLRHAQFRWRPFEAGFEALNSASGLALFDADGNGSWDLAMAGKNGPAVIQTSTSRSGLVTQHASTSLETAARTGIFAWDYDNDGHQDLLAWSDTGIDCFRGSRRGELAAAPQLLARLFKSLRACRAGDIDGDGDLDLAVAEADHVLLLSNTGGNANHWLNVRLRAGVVDQQTASFKANYYGLGSVVEVRDGADYQRQPVLGPITHFGLGRQQRPDLARVIWTTGVPQNILEPDADEIICDEQILTGSCPYLYTWNGERFEFCTDCLWSAPIGLQWADGVLAPSRSWEYLRIDGDKLRPRNGVYELRITEELWEAAYFDQVRLIAVDHPSGVEVYSNEKVGPAELAAPRIYTVSRRRLPRAARDSRGRDVSETLRCRDGKFLKAFDAKRGPGWAEEHFVELDLGPLEAQVEVTLFLTGWIYPTGTSVNVGISQQADTPRPPALWVPDAQGAWHEVRSYLGFPGGKTKTIALDLTDAFLCDDHRLRIVTGMEIYWDEAFFTVDEPRVDVETTTLEMVSAELTYRGFSRRRPGEAFGPERYDDHDVLREPVWPPMQGFFTRYGPVDELLAAGDDLLVVLGAGDEMALKFTAPPLRAGWKREFLLYNVGWDKDADLNTVYGQTVEPLPFGAMSGYPYAASETDAAGGTYPDTPRHREYLRTYQTRQQDPLRFWRQVSNPP